MSLLKTFKDYLRVCKDKNLLIRPTGQQINFLPTKLVNEISHPSLPIGATKEKQNDAKLVEEFHDKIGKGSMFERKNVESYLKSLGPTYLKRADIESNKFFDEQEANEKHAFLKNVESLDNSSTVFFNLEQEAIRSILEKLIAVTPISSDTTSQPKILVNDEAKKVRKAPSHVYTEIPPVPDFQNDVSTFEEYIYLLTHSTFHHKKSSTFNGIIPKILKNFFHPLNSNTIPLRTVHSYNDVIYYFSNKWNIATCRELLVQMKLENVNPNTTTFNIMLRSLLTQQNIRHLREPYKITLGLLSEMKKYGVKADLVTWNLIFNLLKDDISKKLLLDNRSLLGLPADPHLLRAVFKHLALQEETSSRDLLEIIQEFDISVDVKLLNVMVKKLIEEEQIISAWKVIDHAKKEFSFKPRVEQLNLFLVHFSNQGRVDLVTATLNTFKKRFKVKPNFDSYNLVMKSIARSKHWDNKLSILRIYYQRMMIELKNCVAGEYWIRRIRSRLKFIYDQEVRLKPELTAEELQLKSEIENIKWGLDSEVIDLSKKIPHQLKQLAGKLGYSGAGAQLTEIDNLEERKLKAIKYRKKIDILSVQKSLVNRIPYAEDSYGALKKEMKERNIIAT